MDIKLTDFKLLFSTIRAPPIAKLAIISSDSNIIPTWLALSCFFLSQCQILSLIIKTALFCASSTSLHLTQTLSIIHKVLSIGDALDFNSWPVFSYTALTVVYVYLTSILFFLVFLLKTLHSDKLHVCLIQRVWNIISYAHTLLFFYPIHTITLKTITLAFAEDQKTLFNTNQARIFIQVYSCISFALNIFFAAITIMFLYPPIQTKFALSSKTKIMVIISIGHKLLLPLLWIINFPSNALKIFLLVLNLIICLIRDGLFFRILPYYNINALRIAATLFGSLTLLSLASLISKLASQNESFHESLIIMFTSWVLVTPFTMKIYQSYLRTICHRILFQTSRLSNPYYLIHYWPLYKNLTQERAELKLESKKLSRNFLYYLEFLDKAANKGLELNQREEDKAWSRLVLQKKGNNVVFESSQCVLSLFIVLLRLSTRKNSMMVLPKLWLAFSKLKYEKSFLTANQTIQEAIEVSPSISKTISFGLLWLKMLRKLKSSQPSNASDDGNNATGANSNLNMQDFLHVKQRFHKLKDDIKGQLTTQTKFWKDFQNNVPEYDSLMNLVKLTQGKIRAIQKSVKDAHSLTRPNFYEPILILGLYLCFIQNDYEQGQKFLREYDRLSIKERINYLATGPAHKRNSEKKSLYFVLSAHSKDMGKIVSHSKNLSQLLRIQNDSAVGKHINIFAAKAENRPGYVLGVSLQDPRSFEGPIEVRLLDGRGYLLLCSMTITLNFLPKTGLSICILLKPIEDTKKGILINNHGNILQCSEDMENELELGFQAKKEAPNMFSLCPHLSMIIQAYKSVSREESRKVRNQQIENGFNKPSEGSASPIDDGNEDEIFDAEIEQEGGYQRLYQKYSKGDTLIFYPSTNKKLENVNSLAFLDCREDVPVKPVAYLTTIQNCPTGKGKAFLLKFKEKISGNLNEVYANLDPALKIKGMSPEFKKQLLSSSEISGPEKLFSTSKVTNNAVGSNVTGSNSKPSLHNIDAQLEEIKEMETEEANHGYARSSCHVPSSPEITDRYNGQTTDRYNTLLQKEYEYEDTMIKKIKAKEPSLTHLNPQLKLIKAPSDNKTQEITKASKEETGSNILKSRAAIQTTSQILLTDRRPQTKEDDAHDKPSNGGSSVSSQLNRSTRPEKIIRNVLISRRHSKYTVVYASYFLCVVSSLLGFLLWFSMNASTVSNTASSVSDVLQNLYFRCYWTNLANQETRLYVGVKGNISTEFTDLALQIDTTNMTFHKMALFNNQLRNSISKLDKDTQLMFSEKNVNVYVRNASNDLVWEETTDTFQLVSQMLNLGFINVYTPVVDGEVYVDYINPESRFIFDNSFGDLLIVNENLLAAMTDKVYSTFENSERTNISILGGAIAISVLFIMASVAYIWWLNKDSKRFTDVLFTLPHEDIHLVEHTLIAFQDMLDKELEGFDCVEALDDVKIMNRARTATQRRLAERNEKVKNTPTVRQANLFNSNKRNWLLFLRLITIQLLIFGLLIFYYSWSLNRIKILKQQQVIINSALESINLQSLISVELQAMAMDNETTPIRHQPIFPSLENDVYKLSQLTQLEDSMKDTNGNLPDAQKAILIHFSCEDAYSPLYMLEDGIPQYECDQLASTGYTGLLTLLADETTQLKDYLNTYSLSSKDADTLAYLYITSVLDIMGYIDVTTTLFLLSYSTTQSDFVNSVNDLLAEGPVLSGVAGAVVPLLALWSWFYVIRWLASKEFDKKEMLALVPPKMILSNRHLKHYIFRIASSKEKVHSVLR